MRNNNLDIASLVMQIYNLVLLLQDFKNTDIMQELQKQDTIYFENIIKNQEEILKILKERRDS